ncbi:hypothetical protein N9O69_05505 [Alphaproteobacteria bacterium]|nr:hypothetical protein [Alphaproteobacteria bacterium]
MTDYKFEWKTILSGIITIKSQNGIDAHNHFLSLSSTHLINNSKTYSSPQDLHLTYVNPDLDISFTKEEWNSIYKAIF